MAQVNTVTSTKFAAILRMREIQEEIEFDALWKKMSCL